MGFVDKEDWKAAKRSFIVALAAGLGTFAAQYLAVLLTQSSRSNAVQTGDQQ